MTTNDSGFDPLDADTLACPYAAHASLRAHTPIYQQETGRGFSVWYISRYKDIAAILRDDTHFSTDWREVNDERLAAINEANHPALSYLFNHLLLREGQSHAHMRKIVHKHFTKQRANFMEPKIGELVDFLLSRMAPKGNGDLIAEFSSLLPLIVVSTLLGLPLKDLQKLRQWTIIYSAAPFHWGSKPVSREKFAWYLQQLAEFVEYLRAFVAHRRTQPRDDLTGNLISAADKQGILDEKELISMISFLMMAGNDTVESLISAGTLTLLENPELQKNLSADNETVDRLIDELLRTTSPVAMSGTRYAKSDVVVAGKTIRRGDLVRMILTSANRDDDRFESPNRLRPGRTERHIAFGLGPHYCLGAELARVEARCAIPAIFQRLPNLRLAVPREELKWRGELVVRALETLPLQWDSPV